LDTFKKIAKNIKKQQKKFLVEKKPLFYSTKLSDIIKLNFFSKNKFKK